MKASFKRTINWDKYQSKVTIQWQNQYLDYLTVTNLGFLTLNNLWGCERAPLSINPEPVKPELWNFACMLYYIKSIKKAKILIKVMWLFWWNNHILRRSSKLSIFINKSNSAHIMKWVYNTRVYWKCVVRKVIKSSILSLLD